VIFLFIGVGVLTASRKIWNFETDYTHCVAQSVLVNKERKDVTSWNKSCADLLYKSYQNASSLRCQCIDEFTITADTPEPVFFYYGFRGYYQNYRQYVRSRDDKQLLGRGLNHETPCGSLAIDNTDREIAPCGLIAESLFNDSFTLVKSAALADEHIRMDGEGIAWSTDVRDKFRNPPGDLKEAFKNTAAPGSWPDYDVTSIGGGGNKQGYENEDLIVWMRTMATPDWRKLHRILHAPLKGGNYKLTIEYNYPSTIFEGRKFYFFTTTTYFGGGNATLSTYFFITGVVYIVLGFLLIACHARYPRKLGDPKLLRFSYTSNQ
jgi:hypothetical protein